MRRGARAIILRDGKILLGKRMKKDSFYGQWCTFGGLSEANETPEQTLKRELAEELGIHTINPALITVVENDLHEAGGRLRQHFYRVEHWKGKITNKTEHVEVKWFSPKEIKDLALGRILKRVLEDNFDFLSHTSSLTRRQ